MKLRIEVAVAMPGSQEVIALELEDGATLADAIAASRVRERFTADDWLRVTFGVWSRPCEAACVLHDGDRVEVYRPLVADPKDQRRARARLKASR